MHAENHSYQLDDRKLKKKRSRQKLVEFAEFAGIIEPKTAQIDNLSDNPRIRRKLGQRVISGIALVTTPIASALVTSEVLDYRPAPPANVNILPGLPEVQVESPNYKSNRVFLSVRGFGREVACDMAEASYPVTSQYGEAACLTLNPKSLDENEIIDSLSDKILPLASQSTGSLDLAVHAQSAGAKMILPILEKFLEQNANVNLELFILDGSPYDADDILNPQAARIVKNSLFLRGGQIPSTIGQIYSLSKDFPEHSPTNPKTWQDAVRLSLGQRTCGLRAQANAINQPIDDMSAIAADNPHVIFIRPKTPDTDKLIDNAGAFNSWSEEFAKYNIKLAGNVVASSSHAALIRGGSDTEAYNQTIAAILDEQFSDVSQL